MLTKVRYGTWAIVCRVNGKTLYYGAVQYIPLGSVTLVDNPRDADLFKRAIFFWSQKAAQNVIDVIVKKKAAGRYFTWEAVELPEE